MVLRKLEIHMQKNEFRPIPYTICKINSKLIKDLNIKAETVKISEGTIGSSSYNIIWQRVLRCANKIMSNKENNWHIGLLKIKNLYVLKDSINKVERQTRAWEKLFANHIYDKRLMF